jgi:hypothetical protein
MRPSVLVPALLVLCGCAPRADQVFAAPGRLTTGSSGPQPGYTVKLVQAKQAPTDVVGDDGSVCRLTPERLAEVEVGDWIACEWTIAVSAAREAESTGVYPHGRQG